MSDEMLAARVRTQAASISLSHHFDVTMFFDAANAISEMKAEITRLRAELEGVKSKKRVYLNGKQLREAVEYADPDDSDDGKETEIADDYESARVAKAS